MQGNRSVTTGKPEADPQLKWIRNNWIFVAAAAWTGYVDEGRGAVIVSAGAPARTAWRGRPAITRPTHPRLSGVPPSLA
jgi:hypothetical protein